MYACDDPRAFLLLKIYINEKKSWEQFVAFVRMNLFFFLEVGCISGFWGYIPQSILRILQKYIIIIFIERTNDEAEAPMFWPPDGKNRLIRKDLDGGKDRRQEEKGKREDEMTGWHH